jgi:peptide/nickel transport system substrate-binding protein
LRAAVTKKCLQEDERKDIFNRQVFAARFDFGKMIQRKIIAFQFRRNFAAVMALVFFSIFAFDACRDAPAPKERAQGNAPREKTVGTRGGALRYRLTSPPKTFNPLLISDESSWLIGFYLLGGRLVEFNQDEQSYQPSLAESWQMNQDNRTLDVTLRDGLKFSDGHALTSDDVLFTLRALYDERTQSPVFRDAMLIGGKRIETSAIDARRLRLTFPQQVAAPEDYLSNICVLPRHILEADLNGGTINNAYSVTSDPARIVTAGAFMVESVAPGERVALKRNPFYWKKDQNGAQLPYLDSLTIEIASDANMAMARLDQNTLDIVDRIRPSDYAARRNQAGDVRVYDLGPGLGTDHLWFNLNDNPPNVEAYKLAWFKDARFRRAVAHAIDRETIAASTLQGLATPLYGFVSPGNRAWATTDLPRTEYDLEKARALLRDAGFVVSGTKDAPVLTDAQGHRVEFTLIVPTENQPRVQMAAVIQEDLAKLGIKMNVAPVEFQELTRRWMQTLDYEAVLLGTTVSEPDPSSYDNFLRSDGQQHQWHPKQTKPATDWEAKLDELIAMQSREQNAERRKAIFRDEQLIMVEQMPVIPIVARHIAVAANARIGNYRPSPLFPYSLWNADELFVHK